MKCETCRFWEEQMGAGTCHKHAPRSSDRAYFPAINSDAWCGEWERRCAEYPMLELEALIEAGIQMHNALHSMSDDSVFADWRKALAAFRGIPDERRKSH